MTTQEDEYMLVRKKDNAVIVQRLFLHEAGISTMPVMAERGENKDLAIAVQKRIESERSGRISFGILKK